jgi:hypothetical protein
MQVLAGMATGQEFRGSIAGQVTDPNGSAVIGALVTVTDVTTNVAKTGETDAAGRYSMLYLNPSRYTILVEAKGFKKEIRQGVDVRVNDRLTLDFSLEVGTLGDEKVEITAEAPLLEAATATAGVVVDRRRISELPLSDGNPFTLTRLVPGVAYTGDLLFSRPFDNGGTSSIVTDGAAGGNAFSLDGSPNMASGNRVAFVPPADAVQEFKVVTAAFDAQQGHTAGANINVTTRSGTNTLHGTLYEFVRNDILSANTFFNNAAGRFGDRGELPATDARIGEPRAPRVALRYNRYGGTIGGPIVLPKLYNGRNKTFFFFAYEGLKDSFPEPGTFTIPTLAERRGDFSALLSQNILIYDPLTGRREGSRIRRTAFPNNIIPEGRIHPIAKAYLQFFPLPNQPGDSQGRNNFISNNPRTDDFDSETARIDHTFSSRQQAFFRFARNHRRELRGNWAGEVNGIRPNGNNLFRINKAATYDHVFTMSPNTILNVRAGWSRFIERNQRPHEGVFDPATLGFSPETVALFGGTQILPRFEISSGVSLIGDSVGGLSAAFNIYSIAPTLTKIMNQHTLRMGYEAQAIRENSSGPGHAAGRYDFGTNFTRGPLDNSAAAPIGQELAAFLLGQTTGGFIDRNASRANQTVTNSFFFHDDWKVTSNLTLNLGVRYDLEGATTERFNRNVRGFDAATPSPIEAAARAAYAANPIPEIAPANFNVKGGLLFASDDQRGFWTADKNNFQPRIGFAYSINDRTVIRGGWGVYTIPFIISGVQQPGFSQATNIVPSLDSGLTFVANLSNPFPNGAANPPGASQGLATFIGRGITFVPLERDNGQTQRWEVSLQREMRGNWLFEAAYVGNRGFDLATTIDLNPIPRQYLSTLNVRDTAVINTLTANVRNPFQGLESTTSLGTSSTIQRQQLLRPFPHFTSIAAQAYDGKSSYHSGQFRAEKRFSGGNTLLASYTFSKLIEEVVRLNPTDSTYERRLSDADIPHRLVVSGIWEVPFGKGRRWGNSWGSVMDGFFGGWQVNGVYQAQSGRPLTLGNVAFFGDLRTLKATISGPSVSNVFDRSGFYFTDAPVQTNGVVDPAKQRADNRIQLSNNIRTLPSRLPWFRGQGLNLVDLSLMKKLAVTERFRVELRGEWLNAFNHVQFDNPELNPTNSNFGTIRNQANLARNVQLGIKLTF